MTRSCISRLISNSTCASALPRESCTAVTGSCVTANPSRSRVSSRLTGEIRRSVACGRAERIAARCAAGSSRRPSASSRISAANPAGPQRHRARHRLLHVRVSGQWRVAFARAERIERIRDRARSRAELLDGIAQIETDRGQHLVVARATQMQAAAGRSDSLDQQILERCLAILLFQRHAPLAARMRSADSRSASRMSARSCAGSSLQSCSISA